MPGILWDMKETGVSITKLDNIREGKRQRGTKSNTDLSVTVSTFILDELEATRDIWAEIWHHKIYMKIYLEKLGRGW